MKLYMCRVPSLRLASRFARPSLSRSPGVAMAVMPFHPLPTCTAEANEPAPRPAYSHRVPSERRATRSVRRSPLTSPGEPSHVEPAPAGPDLGAAVDAAGAAPRVEQERAVRERAEQ